MLATNTIRENQEKKTNDEKRENHVILTVDAQRYPLADRGRYPVAGYAEVNAGLSPVEPPKFQVVTGVRIVCQQNDDKMTIII